MLHRTNVCHLTVLDDEQETDFMVLQQQPPTNLYYVDIRTLAFTCPSLPCISQPSDYNGPEPAVHGSHAGVCRPCDNPYWEHDEEDDPPELLANAVVAKTRRKTKPSASASRRVWRLHDNTNHTNLRGVLRETQDGANSVHSHS